jgi:hypothetical protein
MMIFKDNNDAMFWSVLQSVRCSFKFQKEENKGGLAFTTKEMLRQTMVLCCTRREEISVGAQMRLKHSENLDASADGDSLNRPPRSLRQIEPLFSLLAFQITHQQKSNEPQTVVT